MKVDKIFFLFVIYDDLFFQIKKNTGGTGGGPTTTREEKIKTIVDDIMEKLPDPFSMSEIMGKVEERTPYVVVAFQVLNIIVVP